VRVAARNVAELTIRSNEDTTFDFRGGQFVWLTVAPHRPPFHDHPFSIASAPTELPRLRFIVQEVGECTAGFRSLTAGQAVALDGPHGSFVVPAEAKCVVLVAGGVGIAPILGMLEEAASRRDLRPFRLLYAARNTEALACTVRLAELRDSLNLAVSYHVDEDARRSDGIGRLTDSEIDDLIAGVEPQSTTAMICGPPAMMEKVSDRLLERGLSAGNIHYERFDYASGNGRLDKVRRWQALAILGVLAAVAIAFGIR
jgi:predicted ferric reductase